MSELYKEGFTQNRELSWLRFNERVLEEAADPLVPVFERLKFISIFVSNLDEFFMVRVGSLLDQQATDRDAIDDKSGLTPAGQLNMIYRLLPELYEEKDLLYAHVEKELRKSGVCCLHYDELNEGERDYVEGWYRMVVEPKLSPMIIRKGRDFPSLNSKAPYIAGLLRTEKGDSLAILPVPDEHGQIIMIPRKYSGKKQCHYMLLSELILKKFQDLFRPFVVKEVARFSITRNADTKATEENSDLSDDFREKMQTLVQMRRSLAPDRMEIDRPISDQLMKQLLNGLAISRHQVFCTRSPHSLKYAFALEDELPSSLKETLCYLPFEPVDQMTRRQGRVMDLVREQDLLSSYPYDSMYYLINLLKEAAIDPAVSEIRMTIYRLASHPRIVEYLVRAAENGKKVRVLIELRARFDEQNNIDWSERLEKAGCKVYYGDENYKVHSKLCQVVLREGKKKKKRYITQIGTGNYNEKTAKQYTDLSLITADQEIGRDCAHFFRDAVKMEMKGHYEHILGAPSELKKKIIGMIEREIRKGERGRIFLKVNSITDVDIIDKLSEASNAGVRIRMIVRGICCILPGIEDCTENVEIVSVVGRYLEHSRVYVFGSGEDEQMYISSADMMTRNTMWRYELACPVYDPQIKKRIKEILYLNFNDNVKGRRLNSQGRYEFKPQLKHPIDSQAELMIQSSK